MSPFAQVLILKFWKWLQGKTLRAGQVSSVEQKFWKPHGFKVSHLKSEFWFILKTEFIFFI